LLPTGADFPSSFSTVLQCHPWLRVLPVKAQLQIQTRCDNV
jgi:hypothetical protein